MFEMNKAAQQEADEVAATMVYLRGLTEDLSKSTPVDGHRSIPLDFKDWQGIDYFSVVNVAAKQLLDFGADGLESLANAGFRLGGPSIISGVGLNKALYVSESVLDGRREELGADDLKQSRRTLSAYEELLPYLKAVPEFKKMLAVHQAAPESRT
ncbi:hypothetical protein ACFL1B_06200 [Nanoarchaeota archaeon]